MYSPLNELSKYFKCSLNNIYKKKSNIIPIKHYCLSNKTSIELTMLVKMNSIVRRTYRVEKFFYNYRDVIKRKTHPIKKMRFIIFRLMKN